MSPEARLFCGLTLILVPTIVYGGLTVLGVVSGGRYGAPAPPDLSPLQVTFYRAGHAHAGVLSLLALFLQIALDHVSLSTRSGPTVARCRSGCPVAGGGWVFRPGPLPAFAGASLSGSRGPRRHDAHGRRGSHPRPDLSFVEAQRLQLWMRSVEPFSA